MSETTAHDPETGDHDRPKWLISLERNQCSRWREIRSGLRSRSPVVRPRHFAAGGGFRWVNVILRESAFRERQGFDRRLSRVRWSRRTLIATSRGLRLVSPIARRGDRRGDRGECAQPIANPGGQAARGIECIRQDPRGVTPWRVATPRRPALWWADRARGRGRQSDRVSSMYLSSIPAPSK